MLLPLLLSTAAALAGPFTTRTSMGEWPDRQVERDFALPRGWVQIGLAADTKASTGYRNGAGEVVEWGGDTVWRYSVYQLQFDQGFSQRLRLYAHVPLVNASLRNDQGTDIRTVALGDVHTGFTVQPWLGKPWAVAAQLDLKSPSGLEWPSDFIGGPTNTEGFLTGTGITNLGPALHARYRFGRVAAVQVHGAWVWKFPGVVGYVMEDGGWGLGWMDPGNEIRASGDLTLQLGDDFALGGTGTWSHRGTYAMGTKGPGLALDDLEEIDGSAGDFVDAGGTLSWEPDAHVEVVARVTSQVVGSDTRLFAGLGLEEFSPQPGLTFGLTGVVRW